MKNLSAKVPSILVIDDNADVLINMRHIFEDEYFLVTTASSGEEAINLLKTSHFDLILTDMIMGKLGGIDVLKAAKADDNHIKVIAFTGRASVPMVIEAIRSGIDDFIEKTSDIQEVIFRIRKAYETGQLEYKIQFYEQFLAICAQCRKIRDDSGVAPGNGEWKDLETFMEERANIELTHGLKKRLKAGED